MSTQNSETKKSFKFCAKKSGNWKEKNMGCKGGCRTPNTQKKANKGGGGELLLPYGRAGPCVMV
jgi:hypothetical protein